MLSRLSGARRQLIEHRLKIITKYNPNFVAVGNAGFGGYIVFGFAGKNFRVLESLYPGNATYVFGPNWQTLSQITKVAILNGGLQQQRIIHDDQWETFDDNLLI